MSLPTAADRQQDKLQVLKAELLKPKRVESLSVVAQQQVDPERLVRLLLHSTSSNPKLLECSQASIMLSLALCSMTGLEPNTPAQEAFIIPRAGTAQFQVGWQGFVKLIKEAGNIASVQAHTVHVDDHFDIEYGLNPRLEHKPVGSVREMKDCRGAYAIAFPRDTTQQPIFEYMTVDEIEYIRRTSSQVSSEKGPWAVWWSEMARKTVFRRLAKWIPKTPQLSHALHIDNGADLREIVPEGFSYQGERTRPSRFQPTVDVEPEPEPEPETQEPDRSWTPSKEE